MLTKPSRARPWLKEGKAKIYPNDLNVFTIQVIREPSGYEITASTKGEQSHRLGSALVTLFKQKKRDKSTGGGLVVTPKQTNLRKYRITTSTGNESGNLGEKYILASPRIGGCEGAFQDLCKRSNA